MYYSDRGTDHNINGACFNSDWEQLGTSDDTWLDNCISERKEQRRFYWLNQDAHVRAYSRHLNGPCPF